jgi:hypothetical protein
MCTNDWIKHLLTLVSMRPYLASPESPTMHTRCGTACSVSLHRVNVLTTQNKDLRCWMLEIDKHCAEWKMQKYRELLEQVRVGIGHAVATPSMPEGEQQLVTSSEPSFWAALPGPTHRWPEQQSSLVAQEDDDSHEHHQWSVLVQCRFSSH